MKIKEAIVVEGKDDTAAVLAAVDGITIETHGFGISSNTWKLIKSAYKKQGIIIFTDPDYMGEEIRRRVLAECPNAKEAFLARAEAKKKDDIGIENAKPEAIRKALSQAKATCIEEEKELFCEEDLYRYGLIGQDKSKEIRQKLGKELAIGYGNGKAMLNKLNKFGITREELEKALNGKS